MPELGGRPAQRSGLEPNQPSRNTGKARIQQILLAIREPLSVLDVGAVGTGPLDLWRSLPLERMPINVTAVDPDAVGIERARRLRLPVDLREVSGYHLSNHFGPGSFDLAVCTQVLEHVAQPRRFLEEIRRVLKPGAPLYLTVDSGHFAASHHGDPLWKRVLRPLAARLSERYYDFGLTETDLRRHLREAGFQVAEVLHCNLGPLKPLCGALNDGEARRFVPAWLHFEEELARNGFGQHHLFRGIFCVARTPFPSSEPAGDS
ncbi:MAG: methyltransferase domain-containing protein [Myxococcales bacterium]|nr:methyltransferase domain-containing protein [Myxococcales bacterium]